MDSNIYRKMLSIAGNHDDVLAKPVDHHTGQAVVHQKLHLLFLPSEHAKTLLGVIGHIQLLKMFPPFPGFFRHPDMEHLVHPVMPDLPGLRIIPHQIIVLVVPGKPPGADTVVGSLPAQLHLLLHVPLIVLEPDLLILGDSVMNGVHRIVNALIHGLDPPGDIDLALQLHGLIAADQLLQLPDQGVGLLLRDKLRRLNGVHQKLQLRQFKRPGDHVVVIALPRRLSLHLDPQYFQVLEVGVNALAVGGDLILSQGRDDLRHGDVVVVVCALQHDLSQTVKLELLIGSLGHGGILLSLYKDSISQVLAFQPLPVIRLAGEQQVFSVYISHITVCSIVSFHYDPPLSFCAVDRIWDKLSYKNTTKYMGNRKAGAILTLSPAPLLIV